MKKNIIKILSVVCLICIVASMFACQKESDDPTEKSSESTEVYYTVSFDTKGGSPVDSVKISAGKTIHRPTDPTLENNVFCRWTYNDVQWVFGENVVKQDMTLVAYWISADKFFETEITDNGDISLLGIRRQESLDTLTVPLMINGKNVVAVSDNAFEEIHEAHTAQLILPESVTSIGNESFKKISKVKIILNGIITELGEGAFEKCTTLTEITLGEGLEVIPFRVFADCSSLERIEIPNGVTKIDEDSFVGCTALRTIVLPSTLVSIENAAFDDCNALKTVFFKGTQEQFDNVTIDKLNQAITDAAVYFYSEEKPTEEGNFWHYDKNNSPVIW